MNDVEQESGQEMEGQTHTETASLGGWRTHLEQFRQRLGLVGVNHPIGGLELVHIDAAWFGRSSSEASLELKRQRWTRGC